MAFPALLAGVISIGFAPIFVRFSEVGPSATAFYRILVALPFLWLWQRNETPPSASTNPLPSRPADHVSYWPFILAGFCFAADLAFWHWAIRLTSIANSTLLTNLAPFLVMAAARVFFHEEVSHHLIGGLALGLIGSAFLVWDSLHFSIQNFTGDILAVITAFFYAGYLLTVKWLRRRFASGVILVRSGITSCVLLALIAFASNESFRIQTGAGLAVLIGLGLISHLAGQGLITFAMAHLPASLSAVSLLLQPVVAASLAWLLLGEKLSSLQMWGGVIILTGIAIANFSTHSKTQPVPGS